jgi:hypothetical protein
MPWFFFDIGKVNAVMIFGFATQRFLKIAPMICGGKHPHFVMLRDGIHPTPPHALFRSVKRVTGIGQHEDFHFLNSPPERLRLA